MRPKVGYTVYRVKEWDSEVEILKGTVVRDNLTCGAAVLWDGWRTEVFEYEYSLFATAMEAIEDYRDDLLEQQESIYKRLDHLNLLLREQQ